MISIFELARLMGTSVKIIDRKCLGGERVWQAVRATASDPGRVERRIPVAGAPCVESDVSASRSLRA
jgi:hypothetical protein